MREVLPNRGRQPTGFRRITPGMLPTDELARRFEKLPDAVRTPSQILAAFKGAARYLGVSTRLRYVIDAFFKFTRPQDWEQGSRPIVWPSAEEQQKELGKSRSQIKAMNRELVEFGLIAIKDSPNGKRYGIRHPQTGTIIEAYGFDLSPLALRYDEFIAVAKAGRQKEQEINKLRRRRTIARKSVTQLVETASDSGVNDPTWTATAADLVEKGAQTVGHKDVDPFRSAVDALEEAVVQARSLLQSLLDETKYHPEGPENRPHQYTYNRTSNPITDTVIASKSSSASRDTEDTPASPKTETAHAPHETHAAAEAELKITPAELIDLAPRLRDYIPRPNPDWSDIVDGAAMLRRDLGISTPLWKEACAAMNRYVAAIAVAIVSTKPREHFVTSPGGYFFGMIAKAKAGQLHLNRTLWALRTSGRRRR